MICEVIDMNIANLRLDDRLVHGVVATSWVPKLLIQRVIVMDKESAENPLMKNVLRMATPKHVHLSVLTPEKAIDNLKMDRYGDEKIMIVIKSLDVLIQIAEANLSIDTCTLGNLGNIGRKDGIAITKYLTIDEENKEKVEKLNKMGMKMIAQLLPEDAGIDFYNAMKAKI